MPAPGWPWRSFFSTGFSQSTIGDSAGGRGSLQVSDENGLAEAGFCETGERQPADRHSSVLCRVVHEPGPGRVLSLDQSVRRTGLPGVARARGLCGDRLLDALSRAVAGRAWQPAGPGIPVLLPRHDYRIREAAGSAQPAPGERTAGIPRAVGCDFSRADAVALRSHSAVGEDAGGVSPEDVLVAGPRTGGLHRALLLLLRGFLRENAPQPGAGRRAVFRAGSRRQGVAGDGAEEHRRGARDRAVLLLRGRRACDRRAEGALRGPGASALGPDAEPAPHAQGVRLRGERGHRCVRHLRIRLRVLLRHKQLGGRAGARAAPRPQRPGLVAAGWSRDGAGAYPTPSPPGATAPRAAPAPG